MNKKNAIVCNKFIYLKEEFGPNNWLKVGQKQVNGFSLVEKLERVIIGRK